MAEYKLVKAQKSIELTILWSKTEIEEWKKSGYNSSMVKTFIKMHGLGNDFVIFDGRAEPLHISPDRIRSLGDRHRGIGFDQMVIIDPPRSADTDVFIRLFNADGSETSACGNATRCIAKLLAAETGKNTLVLETKAGKLHSSLNNGLVTVDIGEPRLDWQAIPLSHEVDTLSLPLTLHELTAPVAVNVGNPHAVFFLPDTATISLETLGPLIEHHPLFPERVNVEIAEVLSPTKIRMRVWERGTGITQACGTGACATAVAAIRRGLTERGVSILLDGGTLHIEWRESDGHVLMTGDATEVYRGEITL